MARRKNDSGLGAWVGWGLTTLALLFFNRRSSTRNSSFNQEPATLSITSTRIGTVIPVVMGQCHIKSPLTSYWGDFSSRAYTEDYGMWTDVDWTNIIISGLIPLIAILVTPAQHFVTTSGGAGTATDTANGNKMRMIVMAIISLLLALLTALFTNHGGRTTIQKGFKYYLGYQQILCWGSPNARLRRIYMNEKEVWSGDEPASNHLDGSPFTIHVDNENLFGGPDENGGFVGDIRVYFGGDNQGADHWMSKEMNADSIQADLRGLTSAYRPFITVVVPTAYVGKSATIPTMWYEVEIIPDSLAKANGKDYAKIGDDANPAEIIKEIVSNNDWGLAESADCLDMKALDRMGERVAKEQLGLSIQMTSKETAESIVENICSHINAIRYADSSTGLMVHRLIRDDQEDMLLVNTSNCSKITFVRQDWLNTISEISVSYTDRNARYETGTLTADDPANIEILNGVKTTKSYDFPYFTTAANALYAAKRVGTEQGYPLANISLECDRTMSTLRLGDRFVVKFAPYGIASMIFRATNVDLSDFVDGTVKIDAVEDVFSLAKNNFTYSGSTEWERDPVQPSEIQMWGVWEEPYEITRMTETFVKMYACQPSIANTIWHVWRKTATDSNFVRSNDTTAWTAVGKMIYDYPEEGLAEDLQGFTVREVNGITNMVEEMLIPTSADIDVARKANRIAIIGEEWIAYSGMVQQPNGNWKILGVIRGIYDTVPQKHSATEPVIFLQSGHYINVKRGGWVCSKGQTTDEYYSITTDSVDQQGQLNPALNIHYETKQRSSRPTVQGRIRMTAHMLSDQYYTNKVSGDLSLTWAPRDKESTFTVVTQNDIADSVSGTAFEKPNGLEYVVEVFAGGQSIRKDTVTNEAYYYSWADRCKDGDIGAETTIQMYCILNGLESWQRQERTFSWIVPTVVGFAYDETGAIGVIHDLDNNGQIVLPAGQYNNPQYIDYDDSPVVLLGFPVVNPSTPGAMLAADGTYWLSNGTVLRFSDSTTYTTDSPADYYTVKTWIKTVQLGTADYYTWNETNSIFEVKK